MIKNVITKNDFELASNMFICPVCGERGFEYIGTADKYGKPSKQLYRCEKCSIIIAGHKE